MKLNRALSFFVDFIIVPVCYVSVAFFLLPVILLLIDVITSPKTEHVKIADTPGIEKTNPSDNSIPETDESKEGIFSPSTVSKRLKITYYKNIPKIEMSKAYEPMQPIIMIKEKVAKKATIQSCGRPWITPLLEVQGKIKKVEYRKQPGTERRGLHLDVETADEQDIVIHVFPEQLTSQCSDLFRFNRGEAVSVSGSEFLTKADTQKNICAAEIISASGTLKLRNFSTGDLEQDECCEIMCKRNCAGKPSMCRGKCMNRCSSIL